MRAFAAMLLIVFCIVLLIFSIGSWACDQTVEPNTEAQQQEQAAPKDCTTLQGTFVFGIYNSGRAIRAFHQETTAIGTAIIAIFTIILGTFTIGLATSTRIAADAARDAAKTAKDEFVASNRPNLRIRNVALESIGGPPENGRGYFVPTEHITGQLSIRNVGGSEAKAIGGICLVYWNSGARGLPMIPPYEGRQDNLTIDQPTLLPGQSAVVRFTSDDPLGHEWIDGQTPSGEPYPRPQVFVMGFVNYADGNGNVWRDTFCREFKITHESPDGRFHVVKNPDYETEY